MEKVAQIKDFLRNNRNIKVKMILICEMEKQIIEKVKRKTKIITEQDSAYSSLWKRVIAWDLDWSRERLWDCLGGRGQK